MSENNIRSEVYLHPGRIGQDTPVSIPVRQELLNAVEEFKPRHTGLLQGVLTTYP